MSENRFDGHRPNTGAFEAKPVVWGVAVFLLGILASLVHDSVEWLGLAAPVAAGLATVYLVKAKNPVLEVLALAAAIPMVIGIHNYIWWRVTGRSDFPGAGGSIMVGLVSLAWILPLCAVGAMLGLLLRSIRRDPKS